MQGFNRRRFIQTTLVGSTLVGSSGLNRLLALDGGYSNASVGDDLVRYRNDIEPVVKLIESTPREKCFDVVVDRMTAGLPYRQLMSGLFLAGIRNIDSAHVGGNLHTVFVIHSAHQLGLDSGIDQRLLPMFWALDYFKRVQESGRQTRPLNELETTSSMDRPFEELEQGCLEFDRERIERALVQLIRTRGVTAVAEPLWRLAARDFVPLGHKAIYMANAWRTLQTIGWQHAEPTLRSLARSLASYHGAGVFAMENQCYNQNWKLAQANAGRMPLNWAGSKSDRSFVVQLVEVIRSGNHQDAARLVVDQLVDGSIQAASVWDAVHLAAGEIILRQANIGSMHGITAANAVHYAFTQAAETPTRLLLLLQGVGFVCHFIPFLEERVASRNRPFPIRKLLDLEPEKLADNSPAAIQQILATISTDPARAARLGLQYGRQVSDANPLLRAAKRMVYAKGDEAHRYKFAAAIFEDLPLVSPEWRPHLLAASTQYFCGAQMPDSDVMKRARVAIERLG